MKLVTYVLNQDGTIPESIVDGGYIPVSNGNPSPQDYNLIGITQDDLAENFFSDKDSLLSYISESGLLFTDPDTNENIPLETITDSIWNKFLQYQ